MRSRRCYAGLSLVVLMVVMILDAAVMAQQSASVPETDAHHAGMYEAFRVCLKQERDAGEISTADYQRCDQTADRLYFGMYNTPRNYRDLTFVPNAEKVVKSVMANPNACQSDVEFDRISAEVVHDSTGFYGDHRVVNCGANPCNLSAQDIAKVEAKIAQGTCGCRPSQWNVCQASATTPNKLWDAERKSGKALGLSLPEAQIYTDYCIGKTVDGIMVVPKACADGSEMRVRQFVRTTCKEGNCGGAIPTTCGNRDLGAWNLDQCSDKPYYWPDTELGGGVHIVSDEPSANALNGSPYQKDFYDFLMCGNQVVDAFQWTRTGVSASQVQWCTEPASPGQTSAITKETLAGVYSNLNQVNLDATMGGMPGDLSTVVCHLQNQAQFKNDAGLKAIQTLAGCGAGK